MNDNKNELGTNIPNTGNVSNPNENNNIEANIPNVETGNPQSPSTNLNVNSGLEANIPNLEAENPQSTNTNLNVNNPQVQNQFLNNESTIETLEDNIEQSTNDSLNKKAKKKSKKVIIISLLIILILALAGVVFYFINNPSLIFKNSVNSVFTAMENSISKFDYKYVDGQSNYSLKLSDGTNDYNFDLKANYQSDMEKGLFNGNIKINYDNLPLLDFDAYSGEKEVYLYSADLYDKYIKVPLEENLDVKNTTMSVQDQLNIVSGLKQAVLAAIEGEKITSSNKVVQIDAKDVKTKSTSLVIDKNNIKNITDKFVNSLTNNQEFLDTISKYVDSTSSELKKELESLKKDVDTDIQPTTISIYTKGLKHDFVKFEMAIDKANNISVVNQGNDKYTYEIKADNTKVTGDVIWKSEKDKSNITISFDTDEVMGSLSLDNTITKASSFEKKQITDSVLIDEITDEELVGIYNKLAANEAFKKLEETFGGLALGSEDYTDSSYDTLEDYDDYSYEEDYEF